MAVKVFEVSDTDAFAFGLSWHVLDSHEPRGAQINAHRERGTRWIASFKNDNEENVGLADTISDLPPSRMRLVCGAAQVAKHPACAGKSATLVTIEEPGTDVLPGIVVMVGVINGNIFLDEVVSLSDFKERKALFLSELNKKGINDWSTGGVAFNIDPPEFMLGWQDLLSVTAPSLPLLPKKPYQVKALGAQISPEVIRIAVMTSVASVVLYGAWFGYDAWKRADAAKRAALLRVGPGAATLYQNALRDFLATRVWHANEAVPLLRKSIGERLPSVNRAGWQISKVLCEAETSLCTFTWKRVSGTMATFRDDATRSRWDNVVYGEDKILTVIRVNVPGRAFETTENFMDLGAFSIEELSRWTRWHDLGATIEHSDMKIAALPPSVRKEELVGPKAHAMDWTISGPGWINAVASTLPHAATLDKFELTFKPTGTAGALALGALFSGSVYLK